MQKLDLKKLDHPQYSAPKGHAVVIDVPEESFLMLDGTGSPNMGTAFGPERSFHDALEHEWRWTIMIRQLDFVSAKDVAAAIDEANLKVPMAAKVRFERYREGRSMQILRQPVRRSDEGAE